MQGTQALSGGVPLPHTTPMKNGPGEKGPVAALPAHSVPLIAAVLELRWVGRVLSLLGAVILGGALAAGPVARLTLLEVAAILLVFWFGTAGSIAGVVLGKRSGPRSVYMQIFQRSPAPPPTARAEPSRRTLVRSVWAALGLAAGQVVFAATGMAVALVFMGTPRDQVFDHLALAALLVAGGWALVCGVCALGVASWFARWQEPRGKVVLCRPLTSGMLAHVYYVADRLPGF